MFLQKSRKAIILFILLLVSFNIYSQQYTKSQIDSLNYWCNKENGIENVMRILGDVYQETPYGNDLKLQAVALGISYNDRLKEAAQYYCNPISTEESKFSFTPFKQIIDDSGKSLWLTPIDNKGFFVECDADWNEWCEENYNFKNNLFGDSQACKMTYDISKNRGNTTYELKPAFWIDGNKTKFARFGGYKLRIRADGNNEVLNQVGSRIIAENFILWIVPKDYTLKERKKCGCDIPIHPEYSFEDEDLVPPKKDEVDNEPVHKICNLVVFDRKEADGTVYKGINWGTLKIVFPNGSWINQSIVPGREYKLKEGFGFNCKI